MAVRLRPVTRTTQPQEAVGVANGIQGLIAAVYPIASGQAYDAVTGKTFGEINPGSFAADVGRLGRGWRTVDNSTLAAITLDSSGVATAPLTFIVACRSAGDANECVVGAGPGNQNNALALQIRFNPSGGMRLIKSGVAQLAADSVFGVPSAGQDMVVAATYAGPSGAVSFFRDGQKGTSTTASSDVCTFSGLSVGNSESSASTQGTKTIYGVWVFKGVLPDDELRSYTLNPWQLFEEFEVTPVAASSISGSLSKTLDAATISAAGAVALTGSTAQTLANAAASSAGTLSISGVGSQTLQDAAIAADGAVALTGSTAVTLDPAAVTSLGALALAGTTTQTLADASLAAAGSGPSPVTGAASIALADATVTSSGAVAIIGSVAPQLADAVIVARGSIALDGSLAKTLDDASLHSTGVVLSPITGALTVTLSDATLRASNLAELAIDMPRTARIGPAALTARARIGLTSAARRVRIGGIKTRL